MTHQDETEFGSGDQELEDISEQLSDPEFTAYLRQRVGEADITLVFIYKKIEFKLKQVKDTLTELQKKQEGSMTTVRVFEALERSLQLTRMAYEVLLKDIENYLLRYYQMYQITNLSLKLGTESLEFSYEQIFQSKLNLDELEVQTDESDEKER